ncbi:Transducin/WD40 repeat-like superfamily protein [Cucumis melo var. makuwa]|uniref:Transducin/WD40 repeat-like superfamily protein n=1 Tax=Cucumis melo var. makuwa TaxID=1194695 RepID=A0A5A7UVB6_CUCMM|nr:Transducin/WD40 repeat-like superfamily protein [Cucumis melo var. makuwa]
MFVVGVVTCVRRVRQRGAAFIRRPAAFTWVFDKWVSGEETSFRWVLSLGIRGDIRHLVLSVPWCLIDGKVVYDGIPNKWMALTRFEVSKFNGNGDFSLWRKKIRAILVQHKVAKILDEEGLPANITESEKRDMDEMAYSSILLYLSDEVLRLVDEATTTGELWKKL